MYFFYGPAGGIRSIPAGGGEHRLELSEQDRGCVFPVWGWGFWQENLVFLDCEDARIKMLNLRTRQLEEVSGVLPKTPSLYVTALDVSPDGQWIVYSQLDRGGSDLMLVEPFR